MTTIRTTFATEMACIASQQASNTREQDRQNARDAWQAANLGIRKTATPGIRKTATPGIRKTATPVIRKKVVKKEKVEKKVKEKVQKEVELDSPPAPTWDQVTAFWSSCLSLDPIKPDQ